MSSKKLIKGLFAWAAGLQARIFNDLFPAALQDGVVRLPFSRIKIPEAKGTQDYLGINYYTQERVRFNPLWSRNCSASVRFLQQQR